MCRSCPSREETLRGTEATHAVDGSDPLFPASRSRRSAMTGTSGRVRRCPHIANAQPITPSRGVVKPGPNGTRPPVGGLVPNFVEGRQNQAETVGLRAPQDALTNGHFRTPFGILGECRPAPRSQPFTFRRSPFDTVTLGPQRWSWRLGRIGV